MAAKTIGDIITAKKNADASEAQSKAAAMAADAAFALAQANTADANATLKLDLAALGNVPVLVEDDPDRPEVFMPDGSELGFHSFVPLLASTPLPGAEGQDDGTGTASPPTTPTPTPPPDEVPTGVPAAQARPRPIRRGR